MKTDIYTKILILAMVIGVCLISYPTVANWWNSVHQSRVISDYVSQVSNMDNKTYNDILKRAQDFNANLAAKNSYVSLTDSEKQEYNSLLNIGGDGIMGYIDIPSIRTTLAVFHGVDESVLQVGAGHIEGTSLPIGGPSTHCVISGHRGLVSAKLFTNLNKLVEGDTFMLHILDQTLTYEVDQILTVLPEETEAINIVPGKDYCTLVTCTPYGINTHRLLIRGHRTDNEEELRISADALQIDPVLVAPVIAIPIILLLVIWIIVKYR